MRLVIQLSAGLLLVILALVDLALRFGQALMHGWSWLLAHIKRLFLKAVLPFKRMRRRAQTAQITSPIRLPLSIRKHKRSAKKKKVVVIFPLPFWVKIRYVFVGVALSFLFLFLPLLVVLFLQDLPQPSELTTRQIPQTTKIYDRHGTLLYEMYANQNRTLIHLADVPKYLQEATLAIEDKNFYHHPGFDISSIIRAMKEDSGGRIVQGGSTITQQLIKSSMLTPEQSFTRKIKEIILAFWTERLYSKNQILEMYFNQVPYGGTAWGVEAAAETYFNEPVKQLDLAQSSLLAGLTSAPSVYSPYSASIKVWKARQKEVLGRMVALGYISQKQADKAAAEKLTFKPLQTPFYAPHFVNYIRDLLVQKYGLAMVEKGGLSVTTSLDLKLQNDVQSIVTDEVTNDAYLNLTNGAALVTNPKNGDILAMVGSKNFNDPNGGNVNLTTSLRQPGSTIKVVTYSAALSNGYTAATIIDDSPVSFPQASGVAYTPVNYDGKFHGNVPLRLALANSLNIPAVKTLQNIGIPTMVHLGRDMGIQSWDPNGDYGLSLTLGSAEVTMLDMATVNGTLANEGTRVDLDPLLKITNYKGDVLEEKQNHVPGRQILKAGVAFIVDDILADNSARSLEFGPNSPLVIPNHTVSVKTGTTDNKRDNWTIGFTPSYLVAVWVGNNDNSPMSQTLASGITGAAPIWHRVMTELLQHRPDEKQPQPNTVISLPCNGRNEYFLKGTVDTSGCHSFLTPEVKR